MTDACENITLLKTSFAAVKICKYWWANGHNREEDSAILDFLKSPRTSVKQVEHLEMINEITAVTVNVQEADRNKRNNPIVCIPV